MATKKWKTPKHPNHELMAKHGWEHIESDNHDEGRVHIYQHDRLGMMEVHHPSGDWDHQDGSRNTSGTDHSSLTKHLHSIHGIESQHAEQHPVGRMHKALRSHGYKRDRAPAGSLGAQSQWWRHADFPDHAVRVRDDGTWGHHNFKTGIDVDSANTLEEHLKKFHGSQHDEEPKTSESDVNLTKHPHLHTPGYFAPPVSISQGRDEDEQFAERNAENNPHNHHKTLTNKGWERVDSGSNNRYYNHREHDNNEVTVYPTGAWEHHRVHPQSKHIIGTLGTGKNHESLVTHLSKFHK